MPKKVSRSRSPKKSETAATEKQKAPQAVPADTELTPRTFCASVHTNGKFSPELGESIEELEKQLKMPVLLLIQGRNGRSGLEVLDREVLDIIQQLCLYEETGLKRGQKIALLIDSPGGQAVAAYKIASTLKKHCGGFLAVIPRSAKSAATLISIGADGILLGEYGELGPLDVQIMNIDREEQLSGLDEFQSLERLHAFVLTAFDQTMHMLAQKTGFKPTTLIPLATSLVTQMAQPMFKNVDLVSYTKMARSLKVGEEYAKRLLMWKFSPKAASDIAGQLVELYPSHDFVIDREEACRVGLDPIELPDAINQTLTKIYYHLGNVTAIGKLVAEEQ